MEYESDNGSFSFYIGPKVPQNTIESTTVLSDNVNVNKETQKVNTLIQGRTVGYGTALLGRDLNKEIHVHV